MDARSYDEAWAMAAPGRVQKFTGWYGGEAWLRLLEATSDYDPAAETGTPVTLRFTGGPGDGAGMNLTADEEITEFLYVEPVPRPRVPEPGVWYEHAAGCPCGASGSGSMTAGDHLFQVKPESPREAGLRGRTS